MFKNLQWLIIYVILACILTGCTEESPTPTLEPTPTIEVYTPEIEVCATVSATRLNLRNAPTIESTVLTVLNKGDFVIINLPISEEYDNWYFVESPATLNRPIRYFGFVSSQWIIEADCYDV